jgi:hypothetical protein
VPSSPRWVRFRILTIWSTAVNGGQHRSTAVKGKGPIIGISPLGFDWSLGLGHWSFPAVGSFQRAHGGGLGSDWSLAPDHRPFSQIGHFRTFSDIAPAASLAGAADPNARASEVSRRERTYHPAPPFSAKFRVNSTGRGGRKKPRD